MKRKKKATMSNLKKKVKKWEETEFGIEVTLRKNFSFSPHTICPSMLCENTKQARKAVIDAVEVP